MGKKTSRSESVTRAGRKFEKKLQFYSMVRQTVASLNAQKSITKKKKLRSRQKKLKAYDLSSLTELLPELNTSKPQAPAPEFKLNGESRQSLILKERNQLKTVLKHPAFQTEPFAAIHQHLQSTQPVVEKEREKLDNKSGKKAKGKKSKARLGPQSMET